MFVRECVSLFERVCVRALMSGLMHDGIVAGSEGQIDGQKCLWTFDLNLYLKVNRDSSSSSDQLLSARH